MAAESHIPGGDLPPARDNRSLLVPAIVVAVVVLHLTGVVGAGFTSEA